MPPVTPDPVTRPARTEPALVEIVQARRPQDMTPETTRELVNCWMTVANAGGAVGFPFPPVGVDDVTPVADQLIADLDPAYSQLLLATSGGVLAGWLSLAGTGTGSFRTGAWSNGFRPTPTSAAAVSAPR